MKFEIFTWLKMDLNKNKTCNAIPIGKTVPSGLPTRTRLLSFRFKGSRAISEDSR
jgi:hypothetical protein